MIGVLLTAPPLTAVSQAGSQGRRPCATARSAYPTFCAIPPTPTDVRPAKAFKSAVVETRLAGRSLVRETAPQTFGLTADEAEAFSQTGQAAVSAGALLPAPADTGAFADDAKREVTPPPLPRRPAAPQPQ